jgi:hypothetical protein
VYIHGWLLEQFSGLLAAFGTTFRDPCGYRKDGRRSVERVSGRISTIISDLIKSKQQLTSDFFKKTGKNFENHQRSF